MDYVEILWPIVLIVCGTIFVLIGLPMLLIDLYRRRHPEPGIPKPWLLKVISLLMWAEPLFALWLIIFRPIAAEQTGIGNLLGGSAMWVGMCKMYLMQFARNGKSITLNEAVDRSMGIRSSTPDSEERPQDSSKP